MDAVEICAFKMVDEMASAAIASAMDKVLVGAARDTVFHIEGSFGIENPD